MRSAILALALALVGCSGDGGMAQFEKNLPRRVMDPPLDLPDWSESQYVRWASVKVEDERAIILDVPGGQIDKMLDNESVSSMLNAEFRAIFLHPRARPWLTAHLGWPSITFVDAEGCLRSTGTPANEADLVTLIEEGIRARDEDVKKSLPMRRPSVGDIPEGGGTWTADDPAAAAVFVQPDRGAPAVIFKDRPWVYGNRSDAELLADRPAARNFLDQLPAKQAYLVEEGPIMKCPLPIPQQPEPVPADAEEEGEADEAPEAATDGSSG